MSLAVTSSITWWFFRPLIAANMPRIMRASVPFVVALRDLGDGGGTDVVDAAHCQGRASVLGGDLLDGAGVALPVLVDPGDGPAEEADRVAGREVLGDPLVLDRHVRDLLERGERGHL